MTHGNQAVKKHGIVGDKPVKRRKTVYIQVELRYRLLERGKQINQTNFRQDRFHLIQLIKMNKYSYLKKLKKKKPVHRH